MRSDKVTEQVDKLARYGTQIVITSVGSPAPIMPQLKEAGIVVLADVATLAHARKAIDSGVDGLILLTAGAGGQTGWLNAFAFVRAVRAMFDGLIVLAGGITDGASLLAARVLGCDLAYMGTKFIATNESMASDAYRHALVSDSMDDIVLTRAFNGLWGSYMRSSIIASGLDPDRLDETISEQTAREAYGASARGPRRWTDLTSAGHSISGVTRIEGVKELVDRIREEYEVACRTKFNLLDT
nr:nitronate monooxygenase [Acetobacter sacchari]